MNLIISKNAQHTQNLCKSLPEFKYIEHIDIPFIEKNNPEWIFFFHYSDIVPEFIHSKYKCVVIHTGNLPKGRGGSPIQNQILEGINSTKVNLLEMTNNLDGGGIYCSASITLQGNINDIWDIITKTTKDLITYCVNNNPLPIPQKGKPSFYKRIKDNKIIFDSSKPLSYVYDQIRMVDGEEYPNPYIIIGDYKLEFSRAKLENQIITSDVKISKYISPSSPPR